MTFSRYTAHPLLESELICYCFHSPLCNTVLGLRISRLWWNCFSKHRILWLHHLIIRICYKLLIMINNSSFAYNCEAVNCIRRQQKNRIVDFHKPYWKTTCLLLSVFFISFWLSKAKHKIEAQCQTEVLHSTWKLHDIHKVRVEHRRQERNEISQQREWKLPHLSKIVIKSVKEEKDKPASVLQGECATTKGRKAMPLPERIKTCWVPYLTYWIAMI